jgi:hypothetical protein
VWEIPPGGKTQTEHDALANADPEQFEQAITGAPPRWKVRGSGSDRKVVISVATLIAPWCLAGSRGQPARAGRSLRGVKRSRCPVKW